MTYNYHKLMLKPVAVLTWLIDLLNLNLIVQIIIIYFYTIGNFKIY